MTKPTISLYSERELGSVNIFCRLIASMDKNERANDTNQGDKFVEIREIREISRSHKIIMVLYRLTIVF